jgi:hypothetical protein
MNFQKLDKILGWLVFFIALATYTITMEKTGSLWDCGEFLSCTYKLQVAHPPGAPFFMLVGKIFSLFAMGDVSKVAMSINFLSALSTAFCSLFFFWSSTMILRWTFAKGEEMSNSVSTLILGSSFLAALAATFLDSMWFNALEGEVYAFSVFFMAFNVWAILKWKEDESKKRDMWLLLIALLTGMSIGVHLLSLLVFPMIGLVIYLDKFKFSWIGVILSFVVSLIMIVFVMNIVLVKTPDLLGSLDLLFVNTMGLPFYSGAIFGVLLIIGLFYYLIKKSAENPSFLKWNEYKFKFSLNTVFLFVAFIYLGFTSYFMVVIRANANTPINMNVPNNFKTLKSYIAREQYGERPLLSGPSYSDVYEIVDFKTLSTNYEKNEKTGKYDEVGENRSYVYDPKVKKIFPRLGHEGDDKKQFYRLWLTPSFDVVDRASGEVIQNFPAGNGSAEQAEQFAQQKNTTAQPGQFVVKDHVTLIDNIKFFINYQCGFMYFRYLFWNFAGRTDDLQGHGANEKGRWISGIGFVDNLLGDFWGNAELDMAGRPDVLSQNKGYNVFYMIPLLLCFLGIYYNYKTNKEVFGILLMLFFATGIMQILFHNQPPIEPRERDYVTAPSFWAFALWMPFGAYFIYSLLKDALKGSAVYVALLVLAVAPFLMGSRGWDDHNRGNRTSTLAFAKNVLNSCPKNAILFAYGDNDTYPLWYAQEIEGIRTDVRVVNTSLIEAAPYISQLYLPMNDSKSFDISIPYEKIQGDKRQMVRFNSTPLANDTLSLDQIVDFILSEDPNTKVTYNNGQSENFLPTQHAYIDIDKARAVKSGLVTAEEAATMPSRINIELPSQLSKGAMLQLHLIAHNMYERPVCFALNSGPSAEIGIKPYLQNEGMIYKFTPAAKVTIPGLDAMNVEKTYQIVKNFDYGKIKNGIYIDENTYKSYSNFKQTIASLALQFAVQGKNDTASKLLTDMYKNIPVTAIPLDNSDMLALQAAIFANDKKNIDFLKEGLFKNASSILDWLTNDKNLKSITPYQEEVRNNFSMLNSLKEMLGRTNDQAFIAKVDKKMKEIEVKLQSRF